MEYEVIQQDNGYIVKLSGDVDLHYSPRARKAILDVLVKKNHLMVDLSAVDYIDSSGVACLVEGYQYAKDHKLDFSLAGVSDAAMNVLKLAKLDTVFNIRG